MSQNGHFQGPIFSRLQLVLHSFCIDCIKKQHVLIEIFEGYLGRNMQHIHIMKPIL